MSIQEDYPKCLITPAFRPEKCAKCDDETKCDMMQWHIREDAREKAAREEKRHTRRRRDL